MRPEDVWYGEGYAARAARMALAPAAWLYRAIMAARNWLYDAHVKRTHASPIPVISVGNLTVGGTGKTPFAAYVVRRMLEMGRRPAIVMRGYGGDESRLHEKLNPGVRVYASPDRVAGIVAAAAAGADVVVLDDAFQHRRAARALDIVLVSAEQWRTGSRGNGGREGKGIGRVLPAGPLRESAAGLKRAGLIVVTSKSATASSVDAIASHVADIAPGVPVARAEFTMRELVDVRDATRRLDIAALAGLDVLAISGVGDPASFLAQLRELGARVTPRVFPDHHAYDSEEVDALASVAANHNYVVTTGKDAVKLAALWPEGPTLWYVSQAVRIASGEPLVTQALTQALTQAFRDAVSR